MPVDYEEGRRLLAEWKLACERMAETAKDEDFDANETAMRRLQDWFVRDYHAEALLNPWRPIEELPADWKDGRDVCVSDGLGIYGNARWHPTEECWLNCDGCVPTHFREIEGPRQ